MQIHFPDGNQAHVPGGSGKVRSHLLSTRRCKRDCANGANLNQYAGPGSHTRWHSDNEPMIGPQHSPKLIVSFSLGNSVEFMVRRRAPRGVSSSTRLDHGDDLVLDGLALSEYEHCTASELQGPRVNLTYRWVAQHSASCPLAGVVGCLLPTCVQGFVEQGSRWLGEGENKRPSSWGLVLLCHSWCLSSWSAPGFTLGGGIVTVVSVHPA